MQGTVVLGTGEPSPIMKRSPSMRMAQQNITGEKLFSSVDLSTISRSRRNSIPSPGIGARTESRGSVPILLGIPGHKLGGRSGSITNSHKYRSLKSYLRGFGDQNSTNELSKLDETLAKIKNQLNHMSAETRSVGERVSLLTNDITALSKKVPPAGTLPCRKNFTLPNCRRADTASPHGKCYNTLPAALVLPIGRTHSQPPLLQINDNWELCDDDSATSDTSDTRVSQESQEDFEVKVIHSSQLDNHHMIVVSSPPYDRPPSDGDSSSCEQLHLEHESDIEDVFDNTLLQT